MNFKWLENMEKYNKVYVALWLLFSAIILSFMLTLVHGKLGEMLDNDALSFFLLFFTSDIVGFIFASLAIDHISWTYNMHAISTMIASWT
jgi:hypothetical protein